MNPFMCASVLSHTYTHDCSNGYGRSFHLSARRENHSSIDRSPASKAFCPSGTPVSICTMESTTGAGRAARRGREVWAAMLAPFFAEPRDSAGVMTKAEETGRLTRVSADSATMRLCILCLKNDWFLFLFRRNGEVSRKKEVARSRATLRVRGVCEACVRRVSSLV